MGQTLYPSNPTTKLELPRHNCQRPPGSKLFAGQGDRRFARTGKVCVKLRVAGSRRWGPARRCLPLRGKAGPRAFQGREYRYAPPLRFLARADAARPASARGRGVRHVLCSERLRLLVSGRRVGPDQSQRRTRGLGFRQCRDAGRRDRSASHGADARAATRCRIDAGAGHDVDDFAGDGRDVFAVAGATGR